MPIFGNLHRNKCHLAFQARQFYFHHFALRTKQENSPVRLYRDANAAVRSIKKAAEAALFNRIVSLIFSQEQRDIVL